MSLALSSTTDIVGKDKLNQYVGDITLAASSAYIAGPILSGRLAEPKLNYFFNYATPFWLTSLLIFLMLIYVLFALFPCYTMYLRENG